MYCEEEGKNNTDYAEDVRQGADGRAARVLIE